MVVRSDAGGSVRDVEHDDEFGLLRLVRRQRIPTFAPVGEFDHLASLGAWLRRVERLKDAQTLAINEERVIPRTFC